MGIRDLHALVQGPANEEKDVAHLRAGGRGMEVAHISAVDI